MTSPFFTHSLFLSLRSRHPHLFPNDVPILDLDPLTGLFDLLDLVRHRVLNGDRLFSLVRDRGVEARVGG